MPTLSPLKGHALYNYKAREDDEVSLIKGEAIQILEIYDDGNQNYSIIIIHRYNIILLLLLVNKRLVDGM